MLRLILIILPLVAPSLFYIIYRYLRYGRNPGITPPQPVEFWKLLAVGAILVFLNILFLVQFDGTPAVMNSGHSNESR